MLSKNDIRSPRARRNSTQAVLLSALVLLAALGGFAGPAAANDDYESNDTIEEAAPVSPGDYGPLRIENGESDFFAVELEEGESLTTAVRFSHNEGDLDLIIYGPDRSPVTGGGSVTDNEQAEMVAEQSGTYYVEVYGYGGASAEYDLSLSVQEGSSSSSGTSGSETSGLDSDRFEPNDGANDAAPVEMGTHSGLTLESGDVDFYAVELEAGERAAVDLYFDHSDADIDLAVLDSNQNFVAGGTSVTNDERATFTADSAGTYYVVVYGNGDASAEYDLELTFEEPLEEDQFEQNDDFDEAAPVEADSYDGLTVTSSNSDYYAIELEEGEMLNVSLEFSQADADIDLLVYGPDEQMRGGSASGSDGESTSVIADEAGTYYVSVQVYGGGGGAEYDMELDIEEPPEGDRFEPNDNLERAVPLSDGTYENLSLFANDADIFTVYLAEGQQFDATVASDSETADLGYVILDESESLVGGTDTAAGDDSLSFEAPADGVYYVVVFGYQAPSVEYELDIQVDGGVDQEGWLERNGEFRYALPLQFGDEVTTSTTNETNDYYAVELAEGETVTVQLDANESGLELVPYGPDREYLTGADQNDEGSAVTFTADADGVYYVVVTGDAEASYDLSVIEGTPDVETESGENATDTESAEESNESDESDDDSVGDQAPGFGPVASALALLAAALFAARRQ